MRRLAPTLCLTALLALTPAGPAAADPGVTTDPSSAVPGGELQLSATGCDGKTAAAKSKAFVADGSLTVGGSARDSEGNVLAGEVMIRSTVTVGTYEISVTCDGEEGKAKGSFTVVREQPKPKPKPRPKPATSPSASPTAPSRAGGGGTASMAAESDADDGPGLRHAVIGGVLATAALLAVTGRILRRRRRHQ
ncbi:hypothetical protein RCO28_24730 [Streptomyces sp. LHD-70]|uniref:hypothetical protein n=1 Tax=Streptomyces sp. LHD-70 TaxID=3072140 RepID=UPI00280DD6D1|nr:hypothetical protein [Streptomyces sp. LHD-70]MDQ8705675.1 hypothetical protein [Streptomyces sp. LHD-70]